MLSVKRIGGGRSGLNLSAAADYYEGEARKALPDQADPSRAADEYLMADALASLATWWSPSNSLAPDVKPIVPGQLRQMLDGKGLDGEALVQAAARNSRVGGWDLTFSAPKAVGVLYATASPEIRRGIADDMVASARAGLRALHDRGVFETRRGSGGETRERVRDVAVGIFPQFTSRAGDPQTHAHGVLSNIGLRTDGSTGALDPQKLYPWKTYGGAIFRAELANRLAQRGVAIQEDGQAFTVAGVPPELIAVWSKRRVAILDALDTVRANLERAGEQERAAATAPGVRQGPLRDAPTADPNEARGKRLRLLKEEITRSTRRAKGTVPEDGKLEARWVREMEELGLTREKVWEAVRRAAARHQRPEQRAADAALTEALERSAVVKDRTLRRMIAEASQTRGGGAEGAHAEYDHLIADKRLVALEPNQRGEMVFTTHETLERERRMLLDAMERRDKGSHIRKADAEVAIAARPRLSPEQEQAVRHTARGDGVVVVEGVEGAGKSFTLAAVVDAARRSGAEPIGLAGSWTAADVVRQEAALPGSRALQGFVKDLDAGRFALQPRSVLIVDEAGMAGSRDVASLLFHACDKGAQVILVGDRRQLASVEPGAPFFALADTLGVARMEDVRRQTTPWIKKASQAFAAGDSVEGLTRYDAKGRIRWGRDAAHTVQRVADAWEKNRQQNPEATRLVLAARNTDVHALNREIRSRMLAAGELGADAITVRTIHAGGRRGMQGELREIELRAGDRLALGATLTKTGRNGLANDVATLQGFTPGADPTLTIRLDRTKQTLSLRLSEIAPPAGKGQEQPSPVLQHAFAHSIHKAKGWTADFAIIHAGVGLDASRACVALTCHREDAVIVADAGALAQRLAPDGEKPKQGAVRMAFLRSAKAASEGLNASDYVVDRDTWLRTGDPRKLPDTAQETQMQAIIRIAAQDAARVRRLVRWRPEKIRAPKKPAPTSTQAWAPDAPQEQQALSSGPRMSEVPATERLARVYAAKVSRGGMGFTDAVEALVSADRREAERALEYYWNPVHPIAIPKGGRRPADPAVWMKEKRNEKILPDRQPVGGAMPELLTPEDLATLRGIGGERAVDAIRLRGLEREGEGPVVMRVVDYCAVLRHAQRAEEERVIAGFFRHEGKSASQVRAWLDDQVGNRRDPSVIPNRQLGDAVARIQALRAHEARIHEAIRDGTLLADSTIRARDPDGMTTVERGEHLAAGASASRLTAALPAELFGGRQHPAGDVAAYLRVLRRLLGPGSAAEQAAPGSPAAVLDSALLRLRAEGREDRITRSTPLRLAMPGSSAWREAILAARSVVVAGTGGRLPSPDPSATLRSLAARGVADEQNAVPDRSRDAPEAAAVLVPAEPAPPQAKGPTPRASRLSGSAR
ncbi:MobF family relaxase [Muricoccus aerilatus]|uniref:MobF family relaxase n=1 Tax=Muricoccus aerilatus TaxID=452982 RepID=UPI0005C1BFAE|nr:MobF family relaxase [Roseomonas aerilata]